MWITVGFGASVPDTSDVRFDDEPCLLRARQWQALLATVRQSASESTLTVLGLALTQGLVVGRGQIRDAAVRDAQVRQLLYRHAWTNPRRGVLCPLPPVARQDDPARAQVGGDSPEIAATAAALSRRSCVISHASAAAVHGLPLLRNPQFPTLTSGHRSQAVSYDFVRIHAAPMRTSEVCSWFGAPVSSVARCIVDVARSRGAAHGLVAADAALRAGSTTVAAIDHSAGRQLGWPGSRASSMVIALADAGSESPLESLTRLCLHHGGLPRPRLQAWIATEGGEFRVDMLFEQERVIVEADGVLKYRTGGDRLIEEKRRQEYLERAGYIVVRVLWNDVTRSPQTVVARVAAALARRRRAA